MLYSHLCDTHMHYTSSGVTNNLVVLFLENILIQ